MVWVFGVILGLIMYSTMPDAPFLGVMGMGVIIVWFSVFLQKLFGLDKDN